MAVGSAILSQNSCVVEAGAFNIINDGAVTNLANFGSAFVAMGNFIMNGGTISCINSGAVDTTIGQKGLGSLLISQTLFTLNGGTIFLENSGTVSGPNIGVGLASFNNNVPANMIMNGGLISIGKNTGTLFRRGSWHRHCRRHSISQWGNGAQ